MVFVSSALRNSSTNIMDSTSSISASTNSVNPATGVGTTPTTTVTHKALKDCVATKTALKEQLVEILKQSK